MYVCVGRLGIIILGILSSHIYGQSWVGECHVGQPNAVGRRAIHLKKQR